MEAVVIQEAREAKRGGRGLSAVPAAPAVLRGPHHQEGRRLSAVVVGIVRVPAKARHSLQPNGGGYWTHAAYDITDADVGAATVAQLAQDLQDSAMPAEINRLGRTIWRWRTQIANWHAARVTNAATEAANNLIKRVKRAAFGFTNFANYRIRALLYAGKPDWALLDTLTPT